MSHRHSDDEEHSQHHQVVDFYDMKAETGWNEEEIPNQTTARSNQKRGATVELHSQGDHK